MMFYGGSSHEHHSVKDVENIKLNFTVLSDAHIEGNNPDTYEVFTKILYDVKNMSTSNISNVYYTKIIDGYYFIVLGSEMDGVDYCHMSDE